MSETYDRMVSSIEYTLKDLEEIRQAYEADEDITRDEEQYDPLDYLHDYFLSVVNERRELFRLWVSLGGPNISIVWDGPTAQIVGNWGSDHYEKFLDSDLDEFLYTIFFEES